MLKRYIWLPIVALVMLALVSTGAIADGDESNPPGEEAARIAAIEPAAKEAMHVLALRRDASDGLPANLSSRIGERADFGMNPDLSRRAIGNTTNSLFVIPADDHVCAAFTVGKGVNLACPLTEDVVAGRAAPATVGLATGAIGIYGIVPDGVESISVQTGVSDSLDVETTNNAYYVAVPAGTPLRTVSYVGPTGPVEFPITDPAAAFDES